MEHGEGEHVRRPVDLPLGLVDGADAVVIGEEDAYLARRRDMLLCQCGADAFFEVQAQAEPPQRASLECDDNFMFHTDPFFFA